VKIFSFWKMEMCSSTKKKKASLESRNTALKNVGALIVDGILSKVEAAVAIKERMKIGSEGVVIVEAIFDEKQSAWLVDTVMLGVVTDSSRVVLVRLSMVLLHAC